MRKIKYFNPKKHHPDHYKIGNQTIKQVASFISYLELNNFEWEYVW